MREAVISLISKGLMVWMLIHSSVDTFLPPAAQQPSGATGTISRKATSVTRRRPFENTPCPTQSGNQGWYSQVSVDQSM